jgi:hypothetical protein
MEHKREKVSIGENEYFLKELTCVGRNALMDIVGSFTFADIMKSVFPLLKELGINLEEGNENDQIGKLIALGLQNEAIWGGLMTCFITILNIGPQVICLSIDKIDTEIENYIVNNLTIRQEPVILKQIIELNKLPDTLGNYKSLLAEVQGLMKMGMTNS